MNLTQLMSPAQKPLSLTVVREHLRVVDAGEDALIEGLIDAATSHLDGRHGILGRALITQGWELKLKCWPSDDGMKLPFPPLQAIEHVKYINEAGVEQLMPSSDYSVEPGEFVSILRLAPEKKWPVLGASNWPVRISFRCGFGDVPDDIPKAIRQAMLLLIGHWYENRSEVEACELSQVPMASTALLSPYKVTELVL